RPLWSAVVVTGLADGGSALLVVLHHVVADGVGGLAVLAALADGAPSPGPLRQHPPGASSLPTRPPGACWPCADSRARSARCGSGCVPPVAPARGRRQPARSSVRSDPAAGTRSCGRTSRHSRRSRTGTARPSTTPSCSPPPPP